MTTIGALYKALGKQIAKGHARKPVCIDKRSFVHNLEDDGVTILDIYTADLKWVPTSDDDGGTKINADGSESGKFTLVLGGSAAEGSGKKRIR